MIRYLVIAAAVGCLMLGAMAWRWQAQAAALAVRLDRLQLELAERAQADAVHRAYIARLEDERTRWAATARELQSMEGRDAPLSDHLRRAAGVLWP